MSMMVAVIWVVVRCFSSVESRRNNRELKESRF